MARNSLILALAAVLAAAPVYAAKLYKWVDERGNISYQDRPPPEGRGKVEEKNLREGRGGDSGSPAAAEAAAKSPVTLYMVPKCSPCDMARTYLKKRGVTYEKEGAVWLGTSTVMDSDDKDRVLVKSDGHNTYFLNDIAYHLNKFDRGFTKVIDIWGADHHGHVPRMEVAI